MDTKDVLTLALAAYGAGLSSYNLFQALQRDRKRVKVSMNTAMYVLGGEVGPAMLSIEVVNVGHRPVVVGAPTLRLQNGRNLALVGADGFNDFPRLLGDGASGVVRVRYRHVAEALANAGLGPSAVVTPTCSDTTGKTFAGKRWTVNIAEWMRM